MKDYKEKILEEFDKKYMDKNSISGLNQKDFKNFPDLVKDIRNNFISTKIQQAVAEERDLIKREVFDIIDSNENKEMQNLRIKKIFIR